MLVNDHHTTHLEAWRFSQGKRRKMMETDEDLAATLQSLASLAIATWDPYTSEDHDMGEHQIDLQTGSLVAAASPVPMEEGKPQPPPEEMKPVCDPSGKLCVMCLYMSMQEGKESTPVQKALGESARKYWETGFLELEKLTHESYALGFLPCLVSFDGVYLQFSLFNRHNYIICIHIYICVCVYINII